MTCTLCTEHAETKQSSNNLKHKHLFISGCNNFRISTVTYPGFPFGVMLMGHNKIPRKIPDIKGKENDQRS